jgi:hypothetical protein
MCLFHWNCYFLGFIFTKMSHKSYFYAMISENVPHFLAIPDSVINKRLGPLALQRYCACAPRSREPSLPPSCTELFFKRNHRAQGANAAGKLGLEQAQFWFPNRELIRYWPSSLLDIGRVDDVAAWAVRWPRGLLCDHSGTKMGQALYPPTEIKTCEQASFP